MWILTLTEITFVLAVNLLPPILDVGIQIWNGVTINQMQFHKNKEWSENGNETSTPKLIRFPNKPTGLQNDSSVFPNNSTSHKDDSVKFPNGSVIRLPDNWQTNDLIKFPKNWQINDLIKFPNDYATTGQPPQIQETFLDSEGSGDEEDRISGRKRRGSETIDEISINSEGSGDNDTDDESTNLHSTKQKALHIHFSKEFQFVVTYEALITIGLLQLPALCLAILGMIRAFQKNGLSCAAFRDVLRASLLVFTPFFVVQVFSVFQFEFAGAVNFICNKIKTGIQFLAGLVCGKCSDTWFDKLDLLHFLSQNKKDRLLFVEVTKMFFGSCIQLCFQAAILFGYTESDDIAISQVISIVLSMLIISKTAVEAFLFKEEIENPSLVVHQTICDKIKAFVHQKAAIAKQILPYLPLIASSAMFHMGTLVMVVLVWEWYSVIYVLLMFTATLLLLLNLPLTTVQKTEEKIGLTRKIKFKEEDQDKNRLLRSFYMSWANLFVITRPIQELTNSMRASLSVFPLLHFIINLITLLALLTYTEVSCSNKMELYKPSLMLKLRVSFTVLVIAGVINMLLVIFHTYEFNLTKKKRNPRDSEDQELATLLDNPDKTLPVYAKIENDDTVKGEEKMPEIKKSDENIEIEAIIPSSNPTAFNDTEIEFLGRNTNTTKEEIKESFEEFLNNHEDGMVDKAAFKNIVSLCYPITDIGRLEKHVFKAFDPEKTGAINFSKFKLVMYALSNGTPEETLRQIFKIVDVDNNGDLTVEELKQVVHEIFVLSNERKISSAIEKQLVDKAFGEMSKNKDGSVTIDDFVQTCLKHNYIIINYIKNFPQVFAKKKV